VDLALEPAPVHSGRWRSERRQDLRHVAGRRARPRPRAAFNCIHRDRHHHHPFAAACAEVCSLRWRPEPTASGTGARVARARGVYVEQGREARNRGTVRSAGNALGHCLDAVAEALKPRSLSLLRIAHAALLQVEVRVSSMAWWRSLSAGRLRRRLGARSPVAGELDDIATSLPSRTRPARRGSRSMCAPTVARRRRRGSRRRRQASTDHARPPGTDRSGNSHPSSGDVSLPSGEAVPLSRPRTRCGSARLRDWR
jgi:hypothetical protein